MKNEKINWSELTATSNDLGLLADFATDKMSGREFYGIYKGTEKGGIVRTMLRGCGVTKARQLARKALNRRGVTL